MDAFRMIQAAYGVLEPEVNTSWRVTFHISQYGSFSADRTMDDVEFGSKPLIELVLAQNHEMVWPRTRSMYEIRC